MKCGGTSDVKPADAEVKEICNKVILCLGEDCFDKKKLKNFQCRSDIGS